MGKQRKFHSGIRKPSAKKIICVRLTGPVICLYLPFEAVRRYNDIPVVKYVVSVFQSLTIS